MNLAAVVLLLIMPIVISSAMSTEIVSALVPIGIGIILNPTEHTLVMASIFSIVKVPFHSIGKFGVLHYGNKRSTKSGYGLARKCSAFFAASLRMAVIAVEPGAP